jgi:bacteriorhodopsin
LGLVVHGLLQVISPKIIGFERGGQRQQPVYTGIFVNNFNSIQFISFHFGVPLTKIRCMGGWSKTTDVVIGKYIDPTMSATPAA